MVKIKDASGDDFENVGQIYEDDWYVDYEDAVTAVCVHVLETKYDQDMGVQIWPKENQIHIATWFSDELHPDENLKRLLQTKIPEETIPLDVESIRDEDESEEAHVQTGFEDKRSPVNKSPETVADQNLQVRLEALSGFNAQE